MDIRVLQGDAAQQSDHILVLGTWQNEALAAPIGNLIEADDWSSGFKKTLLVYVPQGGGIASRRVLLVGLGERKDWTAERGRQLGAVIGLKVRELKQGSCTIALPGVAELGATKAAHAFSEGLLLGTYRFDSFKTLKDERVPSVSLDSVTLVVAEGTEGAEQGVKAAQAIAAGVALARDLGNNPPLVATPTYLAETARRIAQDYGMVCTIFDREEQEEMGMGGLVGVSRGAKEPGKFIVLEYGEAGPDTPTIALVGKGITFDTGGISIKPAESMDKMKMDMQGAGAVIGTMEALGRLKLPIHVVALVAATENMPGCDAFKPGDILKAMNGVTIEVLNTDAEGRLVLADALSYAQRYNPAAIIDLATLTGACVVALGNYAAGAVTNNPELMGRVAEAASATSERVWELPLWDEYKNQIRSDIADIKNTGGRYGGAITAGAFLSHFVGDFPWVHLDIAGVAWTEEQPRDYQPKGATGYGVRLLIELLRSWSGASAL